MEAPPTAVTLRLVEIALPFHRPFSIAGSTVRSRRTVLVGLGDGTHCGWGEAAPFPGVTPDDPGPRADPLHHPDRGGIRIHPPGG